jgi:predicted SprT family Zn-dependent metalloprotease
MKEMNKIVQDLKMEIETLKKKQKDSPRDRKPRKENRSHRCKCHQQNSRDRRENLSSRR